MTLYLSAFFEDETLIVKNVPSLEKASKITRKFIEKYNLGTSYDYGFITDNNKNLLYVVAYNGIIFKPQDYFGESIDKASLVDSWIGKIATKKFNYRGQ